MAARARSASNARMIALGAQATLVGIMSAWFLEQMGSPRGFAVLAGICVGLLTFLPIAYVWAQPPRLTPEASLREQAMLRVVLRLVVPAAARRASDENGNVDVERFRDSVLATIAKVYEGRVDGLPAADAEYVLVGDSRGEPRHPDFEQQLQRLATYPSPDEAAELLGHLRGLGAQTIFEFIRFANHARESFEYGVASVREGRREAVLTRNLIAAGLVEQCGPPLERVRVFADTQEYFQLTRRGFEVARLFTPSETRPADLSRLDPAPTGLG